MADLVWSDPDQDKEEFAISPRFVFVSPSPSSPLFSFRQLWLITFLSPSFTEFFALLSSRDAPGSPPHRGAGYTFGSQVVRKFLALNKFDHMLRAHQLCMDGYSELFDKQLSTVWSAPNVRLALLSPSLFSLSSESKTRRKGNKR